VGTTTATTTTTTTTTKAKAKSNLYEIDTDTPTPYLSQINYIIECMNAVFIVDVSFYDI
jgi:hypothetical protein